MMNTKSPEPMMKIGELATLSGLSVDTIRFYEKQGLIPPPQRTETNYRMYGADTPRRLIFIRKARDLGFTLQEISQLLALSEDSRAGASDVKERSQAKLAELDRKIAEMQAMRRSLETLVSACSGHGPSHDCPILAALTDDEDVRRPT
jgi:MerR family copper efflux transcriptional regulator